MDEGEDELPDYLDFFPNRSNMEAYADFADEMYISIQLTGVVGHCGAAGRTEFSWVTPGHHGLRRAWNLRDNPVPLSVQQEGLLCIPYQVFNFLRFQMNLIVKLSRVDDGVVVDVPDISLPYLVNTFKELPEHQKTFTEFLKILHHRGFYRVQDYCERLRQVLHNAHAFYIHWCKGFGPDEYGEQFENALKHSILQHGGVMAEMYAPDGDLDASGDEDIPRTYVVVEDPDRVTGSPPLTRILGHALTVLGWRMQCEFFDLTFLIGVGQTTTVLYNAIKVNQ